MKKILIIGCFGDKTGRLDGQIVKTRAVLSMLKSRIDKNSYRIDLFNTLSVRNNPFLIFLLFLKIFRNDVILNLAASHSLEKAFPLIYYLSILSHTKIINLGVGGWQVDFFLGRNGRKPHPYQLQLCKKCHAFLPEIEKVRDEMIKLCGFDEARCEVFPNFRREIPDIDHVNNSNTLKLVWEARIMREKGYDIVFGLAEKIIEKKLDITITFYGRIDPKDEENFTKSLKKYDQCVEYKGQLPSEKIAVTLCDFDVMLLPTHYYTEGFPGTILDAYISGLPVIVTEWEHSHEFVIHGESGFVVPFNEPQAEFNKRVFELYEDRTLLSQMKIKSRNRIELYTEERAWSVLKRYL